jgi:tryptophan-rich hypothetical protein
MKKILNSKWTAKKPLNKEKHFVVIKVSKSELDSQIIKSITLEAVFTGRQFKAKPEELKDSSVWLAGWI